MSFQDDLLARPPFSTNDGQKKEIFSRSLRQAFLFHWEKCPEFRFFCQQQGFDAHKTLDDPADYPYLPASLFKTKNLISVPEETVIARIFSSGTSGNPSTVSVDADTARRQTVAVTKIVADYIGSHRRPFLVLDVDPSKIRAKNISARTAAARGFLMFASSVEYGLTEKNGRLTLDEKKMISFLSQAEKEKKEISIFGFTSILCRHMIRLFKDRRSGFKLAETAKILHIGGWKRLEDQKVSRLQFLEDIRRTLGVNHSNVYDFYGFTEQMGLVYGNRADLPKTVPLYAEIIIRDPLTLKPVEDGQAGLIQMLTPLPQSYPGVSLLTEDIGRIVSRGRDKDGRWGTKFELTGRAQKAEIRGCGDLPEESAG